MGPDDIVDGGEIAIYRLIGRIVAGDRNLPTVEELTALRTSSLQTLVGLIRRALRGELSAQERDAVSAFLKDRLDPAVRIKFAKTISARARLLVGARESALDAYVRWKSAGLRMNAQSVQKAKDTYLERVTHLGAGHEAMVELQGEFAVAQVGVASGRVYLTRRRLNNILAAISVVELTVDRRIAEAFYKTYSGDNIIYENNSIDVGGGNTEDRFFFGQKSGFNGRFLDGEPGLLRMAVILIHELVHVDQRGQKSVQGGIFHLEGRPYGVDWHMSRRLGDDDRTGIAAGFMGNAVKSHSNEVADFCMTCVATDLLHRLRNGTPVRNLPLKVNPEMSKADGLYIELMTKVPKDYSHDLETFLFDLSKLYSNGVFGPTGWIRDVHRLPRFCKERQAGSTLFENIADGTFAAPPPGL